MNLQDPETKAFFMSVMLYGLELPPLNEENLYEEIQTFADWWLDMSEISIPMIIEGKNIMICDINHAPICLFVFEPGKMEVRNTTEDLEEVSEFFVPCIIDAVRYFINHFGPGYNIQPSKDVRAELAGTTVEFNNNDFILP